MQKRTNSAKKIIEHTHNQRYIMIIEGALVGVAAGLVAVAYRMAMDWSLSLHTFILNWADDYWWLVVVFFVLLFAMAMVVAALIKWEPYIAGSGIPQVEGELKGYFDMPWIRVIIGKLAASLLCIIGGLSLGREGPSVQLGAMAGKGYARMRDKDNLRERYLITCGASAGLSAAFNCPLSGVMFVLEEIHKDYSLTVLFSAMTSAVVADYISKMAFGMNPVFHIALTQNLPLSTYWMVLVLGVFTGITGALFNQSVAFTGKIYEKLNLIPSRFHPVIPFMVAGILGFVLPQVLGDGHVMLNALSGGQLGFKMICILFLVKFAYSMMCFGSGAPGGSLAPMLVIGAFVGGIYSNLLVMAAGLDPAFLGNFIILAMAGYFAAIVRAPLTAIVLACELTGTMNHMITVAMVVLIAEVTSGLMHTSPLYASLLQGLLKKQGRQPVTEEAEEAKTLVVVTVSEGSVMDGSPVSGILWPESSLVVSILRGGHEFIPHGQTILCAGDRLTVISDVAYLVDVKKDLTEMSGEEHGAALRERMEARKKQNPPG